MALIQGNNPQSFFIDFFSLRDYLHDNPDLSSTELLVALTIAKHRNSKTLQCNPSITRIAKQSKFTRRTVISTIQKLIKRGIIACEKTRTSNNFLSSHYFFMFDIEDAKTISETCLQFQEGTEAEVFDTWESKQPMVNLFH